MCTEWRGSKFQSRPCLATRTNKFCRKKFYDIGSWILQGLLKIDSNAVEECHHGASLKDQISCRVSPMKTILAIAVKRRSFVNTNLSIFLKKEALPCGRYGALSQSYKTFYGRNLQVFVIR